MLAQVLVILEGLDLSRPALGHDFVVLGYPVVERYRLRLSLKSSGGSRSMLLQVKPWQPGRTASEGRLFQAFKQVLPWSVISKAPVQ